MANPFAAIEASINQRALGMLANADADFGGGLVVSGIFDAAPIVSFDVQSNSPQFQCLESLVSSVVRGAAVAINGTNFTIQNKTPDKTGWVTFDLLKA